MDTLFNSELGHYHGYVQLVVVSHLVAFLFLSATNAIVFYRFSNSANPYWRIFLLINNSACGFVSLWIAYFYWTAAIRIDILIGKFAKFQDTIEYPSAIPRELFSGIACVIALLCFSMAVGWHLSVEQISEAERDATIADGE